MRKNLHGKILKEKHKKHLNTVLKSYSYRNVSLRQALLPLPNLHVPPCSKKFSTIKTTRGEKRRRRTQLTSYFINYVIIIIKFKHKIIFIKSG